MGETPDASNPLGGKNPLRGLTPFYQRKKNDGTLMNKHRLNSVPAAAVIRRVQALLGITGRKSACSRLIKLEVKAHSLTVEQLLKLIN